MIKKQYVILGLFNHFHSSRFRKLKLVVLSLELLENLFLLAVMAIKNLR